MATPVRRFAMRVLLLDEDERLLLLRSERPDTGEAFWFPPGGGIEVGEDPAEAARREVLEEVGLPDLQPGPEVWTRHHLFDWRGVTYDQSERWLLCRVLHFEPVGAGRTSSEIEDLKETRWWTVRELGRATDRLVPADLAERLERLLLEGPPPTPVAIGV